MIGRVFNAKSPRSKVAKSGIISSALPQFDFLKIFASLHLCVFALIFCSFAYSQGLPVAAPQTAGMSAEKLNQIDALVDHDIKLKKLPGAVVVVGHKGKIVFRKAYGNRSLIP